MKYCKTILALTFILIVNNISAQSTFEKWPAIKTFHGVMSQTFHPAEEGKYEPIKTRSGEMLLKANALSTEAMPIEFKTSAILESIKKLQIGSNDLDKLIKSKASDKEILASINALHDVFHDIVGLCSEEKH